MMCAGKQRGLPALALPLALLWLAAVLAQGAAAQPANVKFTVTDELRLRLKIPKFTVAEALKKLVPLENKVQPTEQMRTKHRFIYRGTVPFVETKPLCAALKAKKKVAITATKKKITETADVLGATNPCSTYAGFTPKGTKVPATFQILVQRRKVDFKNRYTVVLCEKGAVNCYMYRLSKPCFKGRCRVEKDPSVLGGVFSDQDWSGDVVTPPGSTDESAGKMGAAKDSLVAGGPEAQQVLQDAVAKLQAVNGEACDTAECTAQSVDAVKQAIFTIADAQPDASFVMGLTPLATLDPQDYQQGTVGNTIPSNIDDPFDPNNPKAITVDPVTPKGPNGDTGSSAASAMSVASFFAAAANDPPPRRFNWREQGKVTSVKDQGLCACGWAAATVSAIESKILIDNPDITDPDSVKLSLQQAIDCIPNTGCGSGTTTAGDFTLSLGFIKDSVYPFESKDTGANSGVCASENYGTQMRARVWSRNSITTLWNKSNRMDSLMRLVNAQPVLALLSADALQYYVSGVIDGSNCDTSSKDKLNLAALLVGYDLDEGDNGAWILQAAFGTGWGENGLFKLSMKDEGTFGPCGIFSDLYQPKKVAWGQEDPVPLADLPTQE